MRMYSLAVLLSLSMAPAFATDLTTGPESALYIAPVSFNGYLAGTSGDASVANPTWYAAQWNNPQPIYPLGQTASPGVDWAVGSNTAYVGYFHAGIGAQNIPENSYELIQNGNPASGTKLPCNTEYDLFLAPSSGNTYKTPAGLQAPSRFAQSGPVSNLSNVTLKFGMSIPNERVAATCSLNYAGYLIAVTLNSSLGDSMFYQIFLRDSRGATFSDQVCGGYPKLNANGSHQYCFSTSINYITGQPMQQISSGRVPYNFNILGWINRSIGETTDPTNAHWSVNGFYAGTLMQGGMWPQSVWDGLTLTAY